MRTITTPAPRPTSATPEPTCPFSARFGRPLPGELAELARGLGWRELCGRFTPSGGPLHLVDHTSTPLGRGLTRYEATLAVRGHAHRLSVESTGMICAAHEMLAELGAPVEVERFHPVSAGDTWCTAVRASHGRRSTWALGFGASSQESGAAALLSAARLLHHDAELGPAARRGLR